MEPRRPRDPFGAELRRFADNIDIQKFRPLSPGIGLGHVTRPDPTAGLRTPYSAGITNDPYAPPPVNPEPEQSEVPREARPQPERVPASPIRRLFPAKEVWARQPEPKMQRMDDEPVQESRVPEASAKKRRPTPKRRGPLRFVAGMFAKVIGHGIDLLVVVLSLTAALFVGGYFLAPPHHNVYMRLLSWTPVAELGRLSLLELLMGVYILFALYWVFFKLVVGFTVGQGLFRSRGLDEPQAEEPGEDVPV